MKKVSIVIPAYNKAALTVKTVESALKQTYKNIEVIVVDDGSTDNTQQLLYPYISSNRIKYFHKENGGACSARNVGIKLSTGDYIALIDCDDIYLPEKIELSINYLENNPDFGFVYTRAYFIDEQDSILREYPNRKIIHSGWIAKQLLLRNFIPNSTVVVRKKYFEKTGLFDESVFIPADWDMWLRLSENYKSGYINLPLTRYRISSNYTLNNLEQSEREEAVILEKAFKRNPGININFKNRIVSNMYLRSAINYLLTQDFNSAKDRFILSIRKNNFNIRAILLFIYFLIKKDYLRRWLLKKYFLKTFRP